MLVFSTVLLALLFLFTPTHVRADDTDLRTLVETLVSRIELLEAQVELLQEAQLCTPLVQIEDIVNTTTNEVIDQIVTCRYRDDVDFIDFVETIVSYDGPVEFNDTVTVLKDIVFEDADCMPTYNSTLQMCYYNNNITFERGDILFEDNVAFTDNVNIDLDSDDEFIVEGEGKMTIKTDRTLQVETKAFFSDTNGVEIRNDLTVTDGDVTIEDGYLEVSSYATIGGTLTVDGESTFNDDVTIDDDLTVQRDLTVDRDATIKRNVEARGIVEVRTEVSSKRFRVSSLDYGRGTSFSNITFGTFDAGCDGGTTNGVIVSGGLFSPDLSAINVDASGGDVCADTINALQYGGLSTAPFVVESLQIAGGTGPIVTLSSGSGEGSFSDRSGLIIDQPVYAPQVGAQGIGTESNVRVGGEIVFGSDGLGPTISSGTLSVDLGDGTTENLDGIIVDNLGSTNVLANTVTANTYVNLPPTVEPLPDTGISPNVGPAEPCDTCVTQEWVDSVNADIAALLVPGSDSDSSATTSPTAVTCGCDYDEVETELVSRGFFIDDATDPVTGRVGTLETTVSDLNDSVTALDIRVGDLETPP